MWEMGKLIPFVMLPVLRECYREFVAYKMGENVVLNDYVMLITFLYIRDCLAHYSHDLPRMPRLFYPNSFG